MKVLQRRVQERNEALFSLDKNKIIAYLRKYNLPTEASSDTVFWAGIYKAICNIKTQRIDLHPRNCIVVIFLV